MSKNKNLEDMTVEELEEYSNGIKKQNLIAETKEQMIKAEELKSNEEKRSEEADEIKLQAVKDDAVKTYLEEHPEMQPNDGLGDDTGENVQTNAGDSLMQNYQKGYYTRNSQVKSKTGKWRKNEAKIDTPLQIANSFSVVGWEAMYGNTDSDSGCEDIVSSWSPADVYSRIIWNTFTCKADLFKVAVKGLAINPGEGLKVQIRAYGALSDPDEKDSCACLSCASVTFSTYTLTLKQLGKEVVVCEKDIWDVGNILMDSYMSALSDMWASYFDYQIYSELESATPGTTETLTNAISCSPAFGGSCCSDTSLTELYNAVQNAVATMREGTNPYNPDYIIMSPTVAGIFKRMQTPTTMGWYHDVEFGKDGRLKEIGGLQVIEYCRANTCTDLSGQEMAIIVDSRRAVGAVFGQKPKTYKFFKSDCNSTRIDSWAFFAVGELDTSAIAHIVNP